MEKKYKAIINILGCCISRDIFTFQENNGDYRVSKYINEFDMLSICDKSLNIDKNLYDKCDCSKIMPNFLKRSLYFDMTKSVLDYIKEEKADYL